MIVDQKTYAQILIVEPTDFIFRHVYKQYEEMCPFMCFPGVVASNFRAALKEPEKIVLNKDVILMLSTYWQQLSSDEKKAVLDHELGHIAKGHLKETAEKLKNGTLGSNPVSEVKEKEADAYSVDMNGKAAMRNGLLKAVDTMIDAYRKQGYIATLDKVLANDPILSNRLKVLES